MTYGLQKDIPVSICKDARDAAMRGFDYAAGEDYKPIRITQAVVVQDGTVTNQPTVDFILQDESGQKFVVMMTGNLLNMVAAIARPKPAKG